MPAGAHRKPLPLPRQGGLYTGAPGEMGRGTNLTMLSRSQKIAAIAQSREHLTAQQAAAPTYIVSLGPHPVLRT